MITLACDTSSRACAAALLDAGVLLEARTSESPGGHAAVFMPMVRDLLRAHDIEPAGIGLYACVVGPGSFTGIRTGVAAMQAMAYASDRPAVGISSLDGLAWPLLESPDLLVCPVLDARNRRVYAQAIHTGETGGGARPVIPGQNIAIGDLVDGLMDIALDCPILFCGDGAASCAEAASGRMDASRILPPGSASLRPEWIGHAAIHRYGTGPADRFPAHALQPVYLGRSQAERTTGIDISDWRPSTET